MKKLVTATTIEQFLTSHQDVFPVTSDTLITPSAADLAKTKGIKFVAEGCDSASCDDVLASKHTSEHSDSFAAGTHHEDAPAAPAAPAEAPAAQSAPAAEPDVSNFTKDQIVEAVIRVLDAKGILDKILD